MIKKKSIIWLITIFFLLLGLMPLQAAKKTDEIVLGKKIKIHSKVLKEDRSLWIYPADAQENSEVKRPVLFLLDGNFHFHHVCGLIDSFKQDGLVPDMLVVAIPNTDRNRDFLPTKMDRFPTSGKADRFLAFFKDELIPHVEQYYNAAPLRILFGHSFGGVFVFNVLLSDPMAFNALIAASPSLWYDKEILIKKGQGFFKKNRSLDRFLFYSIGGEESARMKNPANTMFDILKSNAPTNFKWHYRLIENETHGTVPHLSLYFALQTFFSDWRYPRLADRTKETLVRLRNHYLKLSEKYKYEVRPAEGEVNRLGYQFLRAKKYKDAFETFSFNIKLYPNSPNVYDSLGELHETKGELKLAKINYKKAVHYAQMQGTGDLNYLMGNLNRVEKAMKKKK